MIFNVSNMKVSEIVLVSIAVTSQPSTTGYNYGSTFDPTGTVITATYSNGRVRNVTSSCVFTNTSMTTVGTQSVGVTYTEKGVTATTSLNVTVYNVLSSIAITTQPSTRTYNHHANFNPSGAVVTATWADGTTSNVTSEVTWSPTTLDTVGTQTITASYTYRNVTQTTTTTVTVNKVASSLSVSGSWSHTQYTSSAVDTAGLSFTCTYSDGSTASVTPSVSPSTWSSSAGTQTATFSYTYGVTVSATKSASVVASWSAVAITLTNPNSALAFRSISGNLYTNSACTTKASTNTKYTGTTFYYKSTESKPTGSYLYNCGDGTWSSSEPSQDTITTYYNEGSLTACLGTSGSCWSSTKYSYSLFYNIRLSDGHWYTAPYNYTYHRVREASF